jgi:hypothetical protein
MAEYVPPGWPPGVHPPGSEGFERTAVAWLLDVVPADYRLYGVLRRYPVALAAMAVHHADACVAGARSGYRTARSELGDALPAHGLDAVLSAYRAEGRRLVGIARAATLVGRALRGEAFTPQLADAPRQASAPGQEAPGQETPGQEAPGQEARDTGARSKEASSKEASSKEARGKEAPGKEARGKEAPGKEPSGKKARGRETGGKGPSAPANGEPAQRAS